MKVLSTAMLWLGIVGVIAGIAIGVSGGWTAYWHYATLSTGRSAEFVNPIPILAGAGALLAIGGFLAGLALGLPRRKATEPTS